MHKFKILKLDKYQIMMEILVLMLLLGQYIRYFSRVSSVIIIVFSLIYIVLRNVRMKYGAYKYYMISFMVILLIGIIKSALLFDQSVIRGIIKLLPTFASIFLYFVFSDMVNRGKINNKNIRITIIAIMIICLIVFITQFFLGEQFDYLEVAHRYTNNRIRYYFQCIGITCGICLLISDILSGNNKLINYIIILISFVEIAYMQQFRMTTWSLIVAIAATYMISRKSWKKLIVFISMFPLGYVVYLTNSELQLMIYSFLNGTNTFTTRALALPYYIKQLSGNWLLGNGFVINDLPYNRAAYAAGYGINIFLNDNGILGFIYMFGLVGFVWFVCLWIKFFKDCLHSREQKFDIFGFIFPLYLAGTCRTELHWFWNSGFIVLVIYMLHYECCRVNLKKTT